MKGLKVKTIERDHGFKEFVAHMKVMSNKPYVKVGFPEEQNPEKQVRGEKGTIVTDDKLTVAEVATFNEFGTKTIPERSFIRAGVNEKQRDIQEFIEGEKSNYFFGDVLRSLGRLGAYVQSIIQRKIQATSEPANSQATVDRKGSSHPLIDTGQMVQSVRYVVEPNGRSMQHE